MYLSGAGKREAEKPRQSDTFVPAFITIYPHCDTCRTCLSLCATDMSIISYISTFKPSQANQGSTQPLPWQPVTGTTRQHRSGGHHTLLPCSSDRPDHFPPALPCVHDDTTQRPTTQRPNDQHHELINQSIAIAESRRLSIAFCFDASDRKKGKSQQQQQQ
ncbi:hypothetical protein BDD12DRAFT_554338 [Trichophaea hybrida]|nr:hypothetical protein BDD12DRAFT_554338 [Trichophaea hybrida]